MELDPLVHEFAVKYFDLPSNHTPVLQDAVAWVHDTAMGPEPTQKYDYIIHDVFTGGAEPLPLFTSSFLQDLSSLLSDDGVIALNYAGDLSTSSTRLVLNTINTAFDHHCRMFRDQAPLDIKDKSDSDFLNMVVFCTKRKGVPITFRNPIPADFLGSQSRKYYLKPRAELELKFPSEVEMRDESIQLLTIKDLRRLERTQISSAKRHWSIMRKVLPDAVWEDW